MLQESSPPPHRLALPLRRTAASSSWSAAFWSDGSPSSRNTRFLPGRRGSSVTAQCSILPNSIGSLMGLLSYGAIAVFGRAVVAALALVADIKCMLPAQRADGGLGGSQRHTVEVGLDRSVDGATLGAFED